jgi:hypothetical protein
VLATKHENHWNAAERTKNRLKCILDIQDVPRATWSTKNVADCLVRRALGRTGLYETAWSGHHAHVPSKNTGVKNFEWPGSVVRPVRGRERVAMEWNGMAQHLARFECVAIRKRRMTGEMQKRLLIESLGTFLIKQYGVSVSLVFA